MVPATPEARLRLMLDLEPQDQSAGATQRWRVQGSASPSAHWGGPNPWKLVAWTSLAWMAVLGLTVAGFLGALERQDRKLDLLLERSSARTERTAPQDEQIGKRAGSIR